MKTFYYGFLTMLALYDEWSSETHLKLPFIHEFRTLDVIAIASTVSTMIATDPEPAKSVRLKKTAQAVLGILVAIAFIYIVGNPQKMGGNTFYYTFCILLGLLKNYATTWWNWTEKQLTNLLKNKQWN